MPSPFPGMDPYIERSSWGNFHNQLVTEISRALVPLVRPKYVVRGEEQIYLRWEDAPVPNRRPDVLLAAVGGGTTHRQAAPDAPFSLVLPNLVEELQPFVEIRTLDDHQVVTVLEVLSPTNKAPGDGREVYLAKRAALMARRVNVVEIDLLRGGERLPMGAPLPHGDYYILSSRGDRRPHCDVWAMSLRDRLPVIGVPLLPDDGTVPLDLQALLNTIYDGSGYDYSLPYNQPLRPSVAPEDETWVRERLAAAAGAPE